MNQFTLPRPQVLFLTGDFYLFERYAGIFIVHLDSGHTTQG